MPFLLSVRTRLLLPAIFLALPFSVLGQAITANPQGNEYSLAGALPGDQVNSALALNQNGGYLVWEENGSLKTGAEIRAVKLNSNFTKISSFLVNKIPTGDQRKPQVQLLVDGRAIFVWQGDGLNASDVYARILKADGTFATSDLRVNSYLKDQQSEPVVAALADGNAFIAWQSFGQDGSLMGIYARVLPASGKVVGKEFLVNQITSFNQRTPAVATLANGNVVVAWISEFERFGDPNSTVPNSPVSIDVYARIFNSSGTPLSDELLLNSGNNICANPSLAALPGGGFTAVWSEKDSENRSNSWDIKARSYSQEGLAVGSDFKVNATTFGDQYRPKIAAGQGGCLVVWTSLGQDGSREGVFGRFLPEGNQLSSDEFRVNTTTVSQQIYPSVASNGSNRFLAAWSSLVADHGFDLFGQTYTLNATP